MSDEKRKRARRAFGVHPLFLLFGAYYALTGRALLFLSATCAALLHEAGHALYAARIGCRLDRVCLLPCGAIVTGDVEGISLSDEIRLALAGPFVNAVCAFGFFALWWVFPETYPYTDTAAYVSLTLALVNLLPALPLDGGRVLRCLIARKKGEACARIWLRVSGVLVAAALLALFVLSLFSEPNFTLLFFSLFVLAGTFTGKDCRYERIRYDFSRELKRGAPVRKIAIGKDCRVRRILPFLQSGSLLELEVTDENGEFLCALSQQEVLEMLEKADIYRPIGEYLSDM